jgi:hypothetical protein
MGIKMMQVVSLIEEEKEEIRSEDPLDGYVQECIRQYLLSTSQRVPNDSTNDPSWWVEVKVSSTNSSTTRNDWVLTE